LQAQRVRYKHKNLSVALTKEKRRGTEMDIPLWGMAIGAALCAIVGMNWVGWETRSSAQVLAQKQVNAALVKALTPICIAKFQAASNAPVKLAELKKIGSTWSRESFVREGKWPRSQRAEYAGRGRMRRRALQAVISPAVAVLDRV
jgi:hypothetical protein